MKRLIGTLSILTLMAASSTQTTYAFAGSERNNWEQLYENGDTAWQSMHYKRAESAFKSALVATDGDNSKELLTLESLADVYHEDKNLPAEERTLISLVQLMQSKDQYPPIAIAATYLRISCVEFFMAAYEKAEKNAKLAATLFEKSCEPRCPNVAIALNNLGWIEYKMNKLKDAEATFLQSLSALGLDQGDKSLTYGMIAENLAAVYLHKGDRQEAANWYQKAQTAICSVLEKDDPLVMEINKRCRKFETYSAMKDNKHAQTREKSVKGKLITQ